MSIVTMRRLWLLAWAEERDVLLRRLLDLGCVELREAEMDDSVSCRGFFREKGDPLPLQKIHADLTQALACLKANGHGAPLLEKRQKASCTALLDRGMLEDALRQAEEINAHGAALEAIVQQKKQLAQRRSAMEPWRGTGVALDCPGTEYTRLLFGTLPAKLEFSALSDALAQAAPRSEAFEISRSRERRCGAILFYRDCSTEVEEVLRTVGFQYASFHDLHGTAEEVTAAAGAEEKALDEEATRHAQQLSGLAGCRRELERAVDQCALYLQLEEAKGLGIGDGAVICLTGWIPEGREEALARCLESCVCAYQTAPSTPEDTPPTLLDNPAWMHPINVVTEMYSLPDYRGIDPNPLIFWFYIFFFGFMFADVAYGLILLGGALLALRVLEPRGALEQLMRLGIYLGISTALCGLVTGGFFGNAVEVITANFFGLSMEELPRWVQAFSAGLVFNPLRDPMTVLFATLLIGVFQLVLGQIVHIYMEARDGHWLDGLLDTVPWWVFFAGAFLWLMDGGARLFALGVIALVLTQGRKQRGIVRKLLSGAAGLYGVTNWLSDVLSYSRLMALMLATSVIATVINTLGTLPGSLIAFVPIFVIGHLFNIGVNLIGTYVHAARLQYLEFYGKFYKEGGVPFRPLTYRTKYTDVIKEDPRI